MRIILAVLITLLLSACNDTMLSLTPAPALAQEAPAGHMLTLEVFPEHAEVIVYKANESAGALLSVRRDTGPRALFYLPEGGYRYVVRAAGYNDFFGELEVPRNRSLAVWLDAVTY